MDWIVVYWICGGVTCLLFLLQSVFWTTLRLQKMPLERWRNWAKRLRWFSAALLLLGGVLWLVGGNARSAALMSIFGGGLNALIASYHLAVVGYLVRK